eukprot:TRINITY_DN4546_c0_g1_i2.p1 TRINITY_DN4546_c0_g1~~TRINITY_DN4546_c0_g1_i2.p1  ORF type:complete len:1379 (+),score=443.15 TRINITY_DN4546_c0_g1_i2:273-4139(+)
MLAQGLLSEKEERHRLLLDALLSIRENRQPPAFAVPPELRQRQELSEAQLLMQHRQRRQTPQTSLAAVAAAVAVAAGHFFKSRTRVSLAASELDTASQSASLAGRRRRSTAAQQKGSRRPSGLARVKDGSVSIASAASPRSPSRRARSICSDAWSESQATTAFSLRRLRTSATGASLRAQCGSPRLAGPQPIKSTDANAPVSFSPFAAMRLTDGSFDLNQVWKQFSVPGLEHLAVGHARMPFDQSEGWTVEFPAALAKPGVVELLLDAKSCTTASTPQLTPRSAQRPGRDDAETGTPVHGRPSLDSLAMAEMLGRSGRKSTFALGAADTEPSRSAPQSPRAASPRSPLVYMAPRQAASLAALGASVTLFSAACWRVVSERIAQPPTHPLTPENLVKNSDAWVAEASIRMRAMRAFGVHAFTGDTLPGERVIDRWLVDVLRHTPEVVKAPAATAAGVEAGRTAAATQDAPEEIHSIVVDIAGAGTPQGITPDEWRTVLLGVNECLREHKESVNEHNETFTKGAAIVQDFKELWNHLSAAKVSSRAASERAGLQWADGKVKMPREMQYGLTRRVEFDGRSQRGSLESVAAPAAGPTIAAPAAGPTIAVGERRLSRIASFAKVGASSPHGTASQGSQPAPASPLAAGGPVTPRSGERSPRRQPAQDAMPQPLLTLCPPEDEADAAPATPASPKSRTAAAAPASSAAADAAQVAASTVEETAAADTAQIAAAAAEASAAPEARTPPTAAQAAAAPAAAPSSPALEAAVEEAAAPAPTQVDAAAAAPADERPNSAASQGRERGGGGADSGLQPQPAAPPAPAPEEPQTATPQMLSAPTAAAPGPLHWIRRGSNFTPVQTEGAKGTALSKPVSAERLRTRLQKVVRQMTKQQPAPVLFGGGLGIVGAGRDDAGPSSPEARPALATPQLQPRMPPLLHSKRRASASTAVFSEPRARVATPAQSAAAAKALSPPTSPELPPEPAEPRDGLEERFGSWFENKRAVTQTDAAAEIFGAVRRLTRGRYRGDLPHVREVRWCRYTADLSGPLLAEFKGGGCPPPSPMPGVSRHRRMSQSLHSAFAGTGDSESDVVPMPASVYFASPGAALLNNSPLPAPAPEEVASPRWRHAVLPQLSTRTIRALDAAQAERPDPRYDFIPHRLVATSPRARCDEFREPRAKMPALHSAAALQPTASVDDFVEATDGLSLGPIERAAANAPALPAGHVAAMLEYTNRVVPPRRAAHRARNAASSGGVRRELVRQAQWSAKRQLARDKWLQMRIGAAPRPHSRAAERERPA